MRHFYGLALASGLSVLTLSAPAVSGMSSTSFDQLLTSQDKIVPLSSAKDTALQYQSLQHVLPAAPDGWTRRAITSSDYEILNISRVEGTPDTLSQQDHLEFQSHGWIYERGDSTLVVRAFLLNENQGLPRFLPDSDDVPSSNVDVGNVQKGWGVIKGFAYKRYDAQNYEGAKLQVIAGQSSEPSRIHIEARGLGQLVDARVVLRAIDYDAAFSAAGSDGRSVRRAASSLWGLAEDKNEDQDRNHAEDTPNADDENISLKRLYLDRASKRSTKMPGQNCIRQDGATRCKVTH